MADTLTDTGRGPMAKASFAAAAALVLLCVGLRTTPPRRPSVWSRVIGARPGDASRRLAVARLDNATLARAFNLADEVAHRRPCELHKHGRTFAPTDVVALAIARAASESVVKATTSAKLQWHSLHLHESASCGHDDFREISAGETMKNRYRHAW